MIALRAVEEAVELRMRLCVIGRGAGTGEALSARLRGDNGSQVGKLLDLKGGKLVAGLGSLEGAGRRLAG